jgi:hypothetical protein
MRPTVYENPRNHERVVCPDVRDVRVIDGVEYLSVHRQGEMRTFLIRRDAVRRVDTKII